MFKLAANGADQPERHMTLATEVEKTPLDVHFYILNIFSNPPVVLWSNFSSFKPVFNIRNVVLFFHLIALTFTQLFQIHQLFH